MDFSMYLARAWGLFTVLVALGLLVNKRTHATMLRGVDNEPVAVLIAGAIALGLGAAQVVAYEQWSLSYKGLLTLFGWVALLKGIAIIFVPGYMGRFAGILIRDSWYYALVIVFLIVGAYLLYAGFTG